MSGSKMYEVPKELRAALRLPVFVVKVKLSAALRLPAFVAKQKNHGLFVTNMNLWVLINT